MTSDVPLLKELQPREVECEEGDILIGRRRLR